MAPTLSLTEYSHWAPDYWYPDITGVNRIRSIALIGMGLCGEADEVFDETRIAAFKADAIAMGRLLAELGDWVYYWTIAAKQCEVPVDSLPSVEDVPYEHVESLAVSLLRFSCKIAEVLKKLIRDATPAPDNLRLLLAQALGVWRQILAHFKLQEVEVLGHNVPKVQGRYNKVTH